MNKRTYFLFLFLSFRTVIAYTQTNVSGFISTNTTWSIAGSPYIVIGNILVTSGYTLTIEPGVIIKFNIDKALQIDGELIAIGTPENRITFTSNQTNPLPGDWAKIHFSDTCTSAVIDTAGKYVSGSIMKYCDVKYGGGLGFGMIHIITSSPYFSHCNISYSSTDGIFSTKATYFIDSSSVKFCMGSGLHFDRYYQNSCSILIQDDSIAYNMGGGIKFNSYYSFPNCNYNHCTHIRRNAFLSNYPFGLIAPGSEWDSLIVSENTFIDNSGNGTTLEFSSMTYSISCNKFINNQTTGGILLSIDGSNYYATTSTFYISNNDFNGNTVNGNNNSIIHIKDNANNKDITFTNNKIRNNSSTAGPICTFEGSITSVFQIHNNDFISNVGQSNIKLSSISGTGSGYQYMNMTNNNLINPGCQFEFYNNVPYGGPNIYVDNNYWGTTNTAHIDSVIYDFFDFANQSVSFYLPFLATSSSVDSTCPVILPTSVEDIESPNSSPFLFPNPTTKQFTISFEKIAIEGRIIVSDILGNILLQEHFNNASIKTIILPRLPSGIYFVMIFDGYRSFVKKIIIDSN